MIGGYKILLWIGVLVIILPFIGVPSIWKEFALFLLGIILVGQSLFVRHQEKLIKDEPEEDFFMENNLQHE